MRGFIPARGIHRHNQLNAFGLAGDLIEPFRPAVDLVVLSAVGPSPRLTRNQREPRLALLRDAVLMCDREMSLVQAVDDEVESLREVVLTGNLDRLRLPIVQPARQLPAVSK